MLYTLIRRFVDKVVRPTTGAHGESIASVYLKKNKYKILGKNLTLSLGEVDIIAISPDKQTVVIVEVKTSGIVQENKEFLPEFRVGTHKQYKLTQLAQIIVQKYKLQDYKIRFDVIGVQDPKSKSPIINHYQNAYPAAY